MQRKSAKRNAFNAGKNSANQELVYQHMSNHYRRILNAKKVIDTSPPYCFTLRKNSNNSFGSSPVRINKLKKDLHNENTGSLLTDRSTSVNSYKGSWGAGSFPESSRYHVCCCQNCSASCEPVQYNCFDMNLIDRITYDTKNAPSAYCDEGWMEIKAQHNDARYRTQSDAKKDKLETVSTANSKRRLQIGGVESEQKRKLPTRGRLTSYDVKVKQNQFFTSSEDKFYPRISKTEAISKLRHMRVYYPPLRKETRIPKESSEMPTGCHLGDPNCKCTSICTCDELDRRLDFKKPPDSVKEQSQTSSRDSAYNGSSLPESRSPTPDHRQKKECFCNPRDNCFCEKKGATAKQFEEKESQTKDSRGLDKTSKGTLKENDPRQRVSTASKSKDEQEFRDMKEDALYIKLIQDITAEVLQKSLYTNKALKKVMKRHMINNLQILDKDRMLREVDNLRIKLGIPEDKDLLDLDKEAVDLEADGSCDLIPMCPILSDSQFVIPQDLKISLKKDEIHEETHVPEDIQNSIENMKSGLQENKVKEKKSENPSDCQGSGEVWYEKEVKKEIFSAEIDDEDILSLMQIMKTIKEKRKKRLALKTSGEKKTAQEREESRREAYKKMTRSPSRGQQEKDGQSNQASLSPHELKEEAPTVNAAMVFEEGNEIKEKEEGKTEEDTTANTDSFLSGLSSEDDTKLPFLSEYKKNRNVSWFLDIVDTVEIEEKKKVTYSQKSTEEKDENIK